MAVKIRLARRGRKKLALYDVVVADARSPRDGRYIEKLGIFNPNTDPATIDINNDKALDWIMKGAQPTDSARTILSRKGIMLRKHLQVGVNKGAMTQEEADKRFAAWLQEKESKDQSIVTRLTKKKEDEKKSKLAAERKVSEARAEALSKQQAALAAAAVAKEAPVEVTETAEAGSEVQEAQEVQEVQEVQAEPAETVEAGSPGDEVKSKAPGSEGPQDQEKDSGVPASEKEETAAVSEDPEGKSVEAPEAEKEEDAESKKPEDVQGQTDDTAQAEKK